jgi:hypothetical protein
MTDPDNTTTFTADPGTAEYFSGTHTIRTMRGRCLVTFTDGAMAIAVGVVLDTFGVVLTRDTVAPAETVADLVLDNAPASLLIELSAAPYPVRNR